MSEKTLEEEIRELLEDFEAEYVTKEILSLVVARIPKKLKGDEISKFNEPISHIYVNGYNQHYADCIQAIRGGR